MVISQGPPLQSNEQVTTLLQLLRGATLSTFARGRVVTRNTTESAERRGPGTTVKTISVRARIHKFGSSNGGLFSSNVQMNN